MLAARSPRICSAAGNRSFGGKHGCGCSLLCNCLLRRQSRVLLALGVHGMTDGSTAAVQAMPNLRAAQVHTMAAFCLAVGLGIGYLMRGSQLSATSPRLVARESAPTAPA